MITLDLGNGETVEINPKYIALIEVKIDCQYTYEICYNVYIIDRLIQVWTRPYRDHEGGNEEEYKSKYELAVRRLHLITEYASKEK